MKMMSWAVAVVLMAGTSVWANGLEDKKVDSLVTRTYDVGDLVFTPKQLAERRAKPRNKGVTTIHERAEFEPVIHLLKSSVAPETWTKDDRKDGRVGQITPFFLSNSLIIRTTDAVHGQTAQRLRELRNLPALREAGQVE